jgi:UDP-N-acetylmuramyl tripeptide synthase
MHRTTHGAVKRQKVFLLIDSKGERRTEWRMEADRLERGLAGREVRFLPDSYLLDPLFVQS